MPTPRWLREARRSLALQREHAAERKRRRLARWRKRIGRRNQHLWFRRNFHQGRFIIP